MTRNDAKWLPGTEPEDEADDFFLTPYAQARLDAMISVIAMSSRIPADFNGAPPAGLMVGEDEILFGMAVNPILLHSLEDNGPDGPVINTSHIGWLRADPDDDMFEPLDRIVSDVAAMVRMSLTQYDEEE